MVEMDEGVIKFKLNWIQDTVSKEKITELNQWRKKLFDRGLIGVYDNGIGYGNISMRTDNNTFLITGSQTGHLKELDENQYTLVTDYNLEKNTLTCKGPIKASSESLTHASLYECSPQIKAVFHVHNEKIWNNLLNKAPTTKPVPYGTFEMAQEVNRLFQQEETQEQKLIIMAGHETGIISFGNTADEAGEILLDAHKPF